MTKTLRQVCVISSSACWKHHRSIPGTYSCLSCRVTLTCHPHKNTRVISGQDIYRLHDAQYALTIEFSNPGPGYNNSTTSAFPLSHRAAEWSRARSMRWGQAPKTRHRLSPMVKRASPPNSASEGSQKSTSRGRLAQSRGNEGIPGKGWGLIISGGISLPGVFSCSRLWVFIVGIYVAFLRGCSVLIPSTVLL